MPIRKYVLAPLPARRLDSKARPAARHLVTAHQTVNGILESLHVVRLAAIAQSGSGTQGRLREGEVDLLRSALVLSGAGLEAVLKRLAHDTLPTLLTTAGRHPEANKSYSRFVSTRLDGPPSKALRTAILSNAPRRSLVRLHVEAVTAGSIQSERDLINLRDAFGILSAVPDARIFGLRQFFLARNQVAHDLDLCSPNDGNPGPRHSRRITTVVAQCDEVLTVAGEFLDAVSAGLAAKARKSPP
ncbi:MAG: hypothetical protein ACYC90_05010 [Candidatus Nanopelagicales bacterium]